MALTLPNLGLRVWNAPTDPYNSAQLARNWYRVDEHDHSPGKGRPLSADALDNYTINEFKLANDSVPTRVIQDGAVTDVKVNAAAAIAESKLALASDAAAGVASRRTLGTGALQAAAGNDVRLSDQRAPLGTETGLKIIRGCVDSTGAIGGGTGFSISKLGTGLYRITYSPAFSALPAVTGIALGGIFAMTVLGTNSNALVEVSTFLTNGTAADRSFDFFVIGPA